MIKTLRKRHLQIWTGISVLLPVGMLCAWLLVPKPVRNHLWQPVSTDQLPVILKSVAGENYDVFLRASNDRSILQLEWINKTALTSPSAIIYEMAPADQGLHVENGDLIGRIDSRGTYRFALKNDSSNQHPHFVLYDIIHHKVIDQIKF